MSSSIFRALAFAVLAATASAAFDPSSKSNVAVYWGQGPNQDRLVETCKNPAVDIVNVGFVNAFPDNSPGSYPGLNLGNACTDQTYVVNGVQTLLKSNCPNLEADIIACQQTYGKKVFLSLGGGTPQNYYIASDASASSFADLLWSAFGPKTSGWNGPRPFGSAVVDGFDMDIESYMSSPPKDGSGNAFSDYMSRGYATLVNRLKDNLFPQDASKRYYLSAAPQCSLPDQHLSSVIANAWFDFVFVQFYNNPSCSARAMINYAAGDSLLHWTQASSKNAAVKIYVGLPAHPAAATSGDYLTQAEMQNIVQRFSNYAKWGGIMLWEATHAQRNVACGSNYATWAKAILLNTLSGTALPSDINSCSIMPPSVLPPGPTQEGIVSTCNKYSETNGDGAQCSIFAPRIGITEAQLYAWNPVLGANGENCASKFLGNTWYCSGVSGPFVPQPIQSGVISTCNKYMITNGDGAQCSIFAPRAGITEAQLYAWNPVLGDHGQNCGTQFKGNTYYCVGVPTPTAAPAPGPTQAGIINTCTKYAMANPGGTCPVFANRVGISTSQLYTWNSVLGNDGQNCQSSFWANTWYCVGVSNEVVKRDEIEAYGAAAEATPVATSYPEAPAGYSASNASNPTTYMSAAPTTIWATQYTTVSGCPPGVSACNSTTQTGTVIGYTSTYAATSTEHVAIISPVVSSTSSLAPSSYPTTSSSEALPSTTLATSSVVSGYPMPSANSSMPAYSSAAPIPSSYSAPAPVYVSTISVIPIQYTTAMPTGYASASGTSAPSGTGAAKPPVYSGPAIEPWTGAAWKQSISLGMLAMAVGAAVIVM